MTEGVYFLNFFFNLFYNVCKEEYIAYLNRKHRDVLDTLKAGKLTDEVTDTLRAACKELVSKY